MKPYYCKSRCHAARIEAFVIGGDRKLTVDIEDAPTKVDIAINGGWHLIDFDGLKPRQRMTVHSIKGLWLVERYDIACDELKFNVVEDSIFQAQFFPDEPPELVEGHSFERPRRAANA